jgi:hypothetical protein
MLEAPKARHSLAPSVSEASLRAEEKGRGKRNEKTQPHCRRRERSASGATSNPQRTLLHSQSLKLLHPFERHTQYTALANPRKPSILKEMTQQR